MCGDFPTFAAMIKSMTGFGKAQVQLGLKQIQIDIRALNSRQLDLNIRLPGFLREKEAAFRNQIAKVADRGKIDAFISLKEDAGALSLNEESFRNRFNSVSALAETLGVSSREGIFLALLKDEELRGSDDQNSELSDEDLQKITDALNEALSQLDAFRSAEGASLERELVLRVNNISRLLQSIEPFEKERIDTIKSRMSTRLAELAEQSAANHVRFEEEMIYYLEKLDISEEKQRLQTHCNYFLETVAEPDPNGRKLGFIGQEMGREINTIGSKANHAEMQKLVVLMKDELEKIKEQLNNVL